MIVRSLIFGTIVLGGVGSLLWLRHCNVEEAQNGPGRGEVGFLVHDTASTTAVLIDRVGTGRRDWSDRLTTVDAATGKLLAMRVIDGSVRCWPASGTRVWCRIDKAVALLSIPDLATVASASELLSKAGFTLPVVSRFHVDHGDAVVLLSDGRGARIETATLAVHATDANSFDRDAGPKLDCDTTSNIGLGGYYYEFRDGPRYALFRIPTLRPANEPPAAPVATPDTPIFVRKDLPPEFLRVSDPDVLLVLSESSLDATARTPKLSRVDAEAHLTWSVDLGGACEHAEIVGSNLVISLHDAPDRVIAIDLATGKTSWRFGF